MINLHNYALDRSASDISVLSLPKAEVREKMEGFLKKTVPTIPEFYSGKNIFLTGGSGFIGKVLLEKLLRSCPDVGNIYILLRKKRELSLSERLKQIVDVELFDLLREQNPEAIKKIVPIAGDSSKIGLDLSEEDRNLLINEVNIVIHAAASIRFNDHLKTAVFQNIRSAREVTRLVEQLKNLTVFVHVSTAYTNCDKGVIEEKLYPPHIDWEEMIRVAEETDERLLQTMTEKYIKPSPNTYIFTKSLAEHLVNDSCKGKIPLVILRPSIVIPSVEEPVPGWIDNFNGPTSLLIGCSTGCVRILYGEKSYILDHVYVDNFIKSLLIAAWCKAVSEENTKEASIYNCCSELELSIDEYRLGGVQIAKEIIFEKKIWLPPQKFPITMCWYNFFVNVILFHILPAISIDFLLRIFGKPPMILKIQRKVYIANMSLSYFMTTNIDFKTEHYNSLGRELLENDKRQFSSVYKDLKDYYRIAAIGSKKYLLNEGEIVSRQAVIIDKCLLILDRIVKIAWYTLIAYMIYCNRHIIQLQFERFLTYVESL